MSIPYIEQIKRDLRTWCRCRYKRISCPFHYAIARYYRKPLDQIESEKALQYAYDNEVELVAYCYVCSVITGYSRYMLGSRAGCPCGSLSSSVVYELVKLWLKEQRSNLKIKDQRVKSLK